MQQKHVLPPNTNRGQIIEVTDTNRTCIRLSFANLDALLLRSVSFLLAPFQKSESLAASVRAATFGS